MVAGAGPGRTRRGVNREVLFESPWCRLVAEPTPTGPYYLLEVRDYVAVVARTADGRLLLVRQHRAAVGGESVELPSGLVDDGERPEDAARRELAEETGWQAGTLEFLGALTPDVGRLVNRMWCYFAPDVTPAPELAVAEDGLTAFSVPEAEALAMAADGRMVHASHVAVLFLAMARGKMSW